MKSWTSSEEPSLLHFPNLPHHLRRVFFTLCVWLCARGAFAGGAKWVFPRKADNPRIWGLRDGIVIALWPNGLGPGAGSGGPRGLFRVGYAKNGVAQMVNFIAVEPVDMKGRRGFSELERSPRDGRAGLLFDLITSSPGSGAFQTVVSSTSLAFTVRTERFVNGTQIDVTVRLDARRSEEILFSVRATSQSAPLRQCILTATMGNFIRARELHLAERKVTAAELWPDYRGDGFAPDRFFGLDQLERDREGSIVVCITSNESNPAAIRPNARPWWWYRGEPVAQYWKKLAGTQQFDLRAKVNGRYCYWQSRDPIPGGVAFENFELNERYRPGQVFVFGVTQSQPVGKMR